MSRKKDLQRLIRHYKTVTGETEVDMKKVAVLARDMGWPMPEPKDPLDILAKQLSTAAREEYRKDKRTGRLIGPTTRWRSSRAQKRCIFGSTSTKPPGRRSSNPSQCAANKW